METKKKDKGLPEREVLKQCMAWLKAHGVFCWRVNIVKGKMAYGGYIGGGMAGVSDILGVLPNGKFLAVECKREKGGKLSPQQADFIGKVNTLGGVAFVVNSVDALADCIKSYV